MNRFAVNFVVACNVLVPAICVAQVGKPNILVIWGDDIGTSNVSAYDDGVMGHTTSNIDCLANESIRFLHYYGEQSCTAGRAIVSSQTFAFDSKLFYF